MSKALEDNFVVFVVYAEDLADSDDVSRTLCSIPDDGRIAYEDEGERPDARWTAFVKAGDVVDPRYVKWLRQFQGEWGCMIFRLEKADGKVLPDRDTPVYETGGVGASFAIRTAVLDEYNILVPGLSDTQIGEVLEELKSHGIRLYANQEVAVREVARESA